MALIRTHTGSQADAGTRTRAWRARPSAGLALAVSLALLPCGLACGRVSVGDDKPAAAATEIVSEPTRSEATPTAEDPLAGTWWVFAKDLPIRALRMNLSPASGLADVHEGYWVSFDWRASTQEEQLVRRSKPVAISTHQEGELDTTDCIA